MLLQLLSVQCSFEDSLPLLYPGPKHVDLKKLRIHLNRDPDKLVLITKSNKKRTSTATNPIVTLSCFNNFSLTGPIGTLKIIKEPHKHVFTMQISILTSDSKHGHD